MTDATDQPISRLRAGAVDINAHKVRQVATIVILVALAALSVIFFLGGAHRNSQIASLRQHGVPITARVTSCLGLLGGSGSNAAGYVCKGAFTLDGHHYDETLPGSSFEQPGTPLHEVSLPSDPGLLETPAQVTADHTSNKVYILPTVLLVAFLALGSVVAVQLRRHRSAS
jgi:hypothetical protein